MEEQLIEFVRKNSFLYDKKHDMYRNKSLTDKKWLELAKKVKVPVDTLKKRWKSLRDRFFRLRKIAASSGSGQKSPDGISYKYFESLQFLCDVESESERKNEANEVSDDNSYNYLESLQFLCDVEPENILINSTTENLPKEDEEEENFDNEELYSVDEASCSTNETVSSNPLTVSRKRKRIESEMVHVLKTMKSFAAQNVTPFRIFLESIALTVESANCSLKQQTRLQMKILQVVQEEILSNSDL